MEGDASVLPSHQWPSRTKRRSESQVVGIEFAGLQAAEVDSIEVPFNLFKSYVFTSENLTDEDRALVPADIASIIHTSSLGVRRIDICFCVARQQPCAWSIEASRCFVAERFVGRS